MLSSVLDRCIVAVATALASGVALADGGAPRILLEPIFWLQLDVAKAKLDPMPEDVRNKCLEIADNDYLLSQQWVYAMTRDSGTTSYVVSGYFKRRHPDPGEAMYRVDRLGVIEVFDPLLGK